MKKFTSAGSQLTQSDKYSGNDEKAGSSRTNFDLKPMPSRKLN